MSDVKTPSQFFRFVIARVALRLSKPRGCYPTASLISTYASFSFSSQAHAQWNRTPLISQDRISIGNRHTVRGFDGEMTLMAERGSWWRNELAWCFAPGQQFYLLWDSGHVSGPSTKWLAGSYLEGYGFGLRGQVRIGGILYYDIFTARPAKYPEAFPVAHSVIGAALSYSF